MKLKIHILLFAYVLVYVLFQNLIAQYKKIEHPNIRTEGNYFTKEGILYSDAIVIKFNSLVIDLPQNYKFANIEDIDNNNTELIQKFSALSEKFGPINFIKQIPNAKWGETESKNKNTNELIHIKDVSQLFTVKFTNPVPLDSTLNVFKNLNEVKYVHNPVSVYYHREPDDPKYTSGQQWNLDVIDAVNAWEITKGSGSIKIAIIDEGININHIDLTIDGGNTYNGEHGTWVAGVASSITDNDEGVASLGWNLSLYNYGDE